MGGLVTTLVDAAPAVEGAVVRMVPEIASRTPALYRSFVARLKTAGATVGDSMQSLITWVKKDPLNAVLAAITAGSIGIDLFKDDPSQKGLSAAMSPLLDGRASFADHAKELAAGTVSETLKLNIASSASDMKTAAEILRWARGFFGSAEAARRGHVMLQAFVEMPFSDVDAGYDTLRV